ncbi:hypothetical protein [Streptomyces sp. Ag109_O5-10]|uniref:hypothetical protein n=1 Tax=Streptomyces sp. Ag109_O5-10 TaxID=1855349 RepID=UPI000897842F|nr:hypothetical protein [Streptomyces sp. Ag109_O5-10]SEE11607.1 hypothetical protein SAMN05216533_1422 [Streptomyces sp. Ag109_O5-10]
MIADRQGNWFQLKVADGASAAAVGILAGDGRTRRIRNTARAGLNAGLRQQSGR